MFLLSNSKRIVIEIDGIWHYAEDEELRVAKYTYPRRYASQQRYAKMVSEQRDMVLKGYEVYRFGGSELYDEKKGKELAKDFIKALFDKHRIAY